ncbi:uncharacterized protein LOC128228543 [Mya arenaria]|uniref:uncharacterized protein LOC128228363 n=1 Tax=Mya arenaria TaxID=6604 RepID=UPI0022E9138B|nr:uncharacterized protein LOC128228363 [Mya arenaria]XP_052795872.1 uncharacterized protein LOC128228543 [Mya arenaria]
MAAPIRAIKSGNRLLQLYGVQCSTVISRCKSNKRDDGPPPWAAVQTPTGHSHTCMFYAKLSDRDRWQRRREFVNKPWMDIMENYGKRKKQEEASGKPQQEPPKLLMVTQVRSVKGRPFWERDWLTQLGIKEKGKPYILKNKEGSNNLLKKVSHLVEIFPVTFPYGPPTSEDDLDHCVLCDNGEFIIKKRLSSQEQIETSMPTTEQLPDGKFEISQELLDKTLEYKKQNYQIHQEYYQTKYIYTKNQDKKEYRYNGDQSIGFDKIWH